MPGDSKTIRIQIEGMSCMSCVGRVEKALKSAAGVHSVSVQLKPGDARVEYDPNRVDPAQLCALITKQGYTAKPASS